MLMSGCAVEGGSLETCMVCMSCKAICLYSPLLLCTKCSPASDQIRLSLDDQYAMTIIYAKAFYLTDSMEDTGITHIHLLQSRMYTV